MGSLNGHLERHPWHRGDDKGILKGDAEEHPEGHLSGHPEGGAMIRGTLASILKSILCTGAMIRTP